MAPSIPRVFISYSHDSLQHEERVLGLAERLRLDGIDAQIDQYVVGTPSEGWPRWMLNRLDWADFVLLICTKIYYQRFRGRDESARGRGADWEGQLVTLDLYNAKSQTVRFVPVLFSSEDESFLPEPLRAHTYYVLDPNDTSSEQRYADLYAFLSGQAGIPPGALGVLKTLAPKKVTPIAFGTGEASEPAADELKKPAAPLSPAPRADSTQSPSQPFHVKINTRRSLYLSYASADRATGQDLAGALSHAGCKVVCHSELFDSSGISLRDVAKAIARSDLMILLWSEAASRSDRVSFDYNMAIALREPIVLCLLDATPLKPPFDIKRGIPLNQLPDLLGHILDFLPEDIKQPSQSSVTKILNSIPDVSVSAEQDALKRITKNLGKQGLLSPRLNDHHSEDVYMPDPGSKPNPLYKKILLGLVGVAGAGIVATLGWLFDPKNLSTATEAGQHLMSIVAAVSQSPPSHTPETWNQYVLGWKQEILHRQMQDGGFRILTDPMSSTQAWTSAQSLRGLLSSAELVAVSATPIRDGFTFLEGDRTGAFQGGWGLWGLTQYPLSELTAWAILAEAASMKEGIVDDIWSPREQEKVCEKVMRDLDCNLKVQDDISGGWKPIVGAGTTELRTYSTAMALWSEIDAMSTPRIRRYIGDRYSQSINKGLFWLKETYNQELAGWVPKPSRRGQTVRFPGLTSQIICIIELAQSQPEFNHIASWEPFKQAKEHLLTELRSITKFTAIREDQIETLDQGVPPILTLEGSTFQVYPWALAACHLIKKDASVSESDRRMAASTEERLQAMGPAFNARLRGGAAETYELAEALIGVLMTR